MKEKYLLFLFMATACATEPQIPESDLVYEPIFTESLQSALATRVSGDSCRILSCSTLRSDPSHYVCSGEFAFMTSERALAFFAPALKASRLPATRVDFRAEESVGSQFAGALISGLASGAAGAAISHTACCVSTSFSATSFDIVLTPNSPASH